MRKRRRKTYTLERKLPLFRDDRIVHVENCRESTAKATSFARPQDTRSVYESQLYFYVPATNNQK